MMKFNALMNPLVARRPMLLCVVLLAFLALAIPARAEIRFSSFSSTLTDPSGVPLGDVQAGSHPDLVTDFMVETVPVEGAPSPEPVEQLKDVDIDLPPGFFGNPTVVGQCPVALLVAEGSPCPVDAQIGFAEVRIGPDPTALGFEGYFPSGVYNLPPQHGDVATFGFTALGLLVEMRVSLRSDGDYRIRTSMHNINQGFPVYGSKVTLWGVPGDPIHDPQRWASLFNGGHRSGLPVRPFLTTPTRCDAPVAITMRARSWQDPTWTTVSDEHPAMTGCDRLVFDPTIRARPAVAAPDKPSAYDVDLRIPQTDSLTLPATPTLQKAVVTLPPGVAISPASAQGLQACSDEQMARGSAAEPSCPDASKIGTVDIDTPLLPDPLKGDIILGTPKPGQLFRLWLVARGGGVLLKLPGVAQPDPKTGQLTTTFDNTPQLPFSSLHLHFKSGARAPLVNPQSCGTKTTTAELTPWAGPVATSTDSFDIAGCTGGFNPTYEAGTVNPLAGAFSPFVMTIRRNDGDQELSKIAADLPPGLLGILAGIPQCPEAQVVVGTCSDASQLGTVTVESGSGDQPLPLTGKVFLAGAYKGQPYSLAFVVRAVAGPFDLGTVIIRAPLNIDASAGKVSVAADPLPTILEGVPLRLRTISITLDRPGFMFNATNCSPMAVGATLTSVNGAVSTPSSLYHASGCAALPLKPDLKIRLTGGKKQMAKKGHPGVTADLSQTPGQSGLKQAVVPLPAGVTVDLKNLGNICSIADAAARKCADGAIVGRARVKTPALPVELTGPVYFVVGDKSSGGGPLPRLWLKLSGGGVPLDLWANTAITKSGQVITTFAGIPDAPISTFHLEINGGAKGILQTVRDQCTAARTSRTVLEGQNGRVVRHTVRFGSDCAPRISKTTVTSSAVTLTVTGIGAGKLAVSGRGALRASKTVKSNDKATITARLSAATKRAVARTGRARIRLAVTYTPTTGKAVTLRKTVTIRRS